MNRRVVVVDDSSFLIKKLVEFINSLTGYEVVATGSDGNDAVELYKKHQPDLLALDMIMPNVNGHEAIEKIFALYPKARILIISAAKGDLITDALRMGAANYVEKPIRFDDPDYIQEFLRTLDEIFSNKTGVSKER